MKKLIAHIDHFLERKQDRKIKSMLVKYDAATIARLLDQLSKGKVKVFGLLPPEIQADVMVALEEQTKLHILPKLSDFTLARLLHFTDEDDAADILQLVDATRQKTVLILLRDPKRKKIEKLLTYGPETAGGLMDLSFICVGKDSIVKEITKKIHAHTATEEQAPLVIVTNEDQKPVGFLPYRQILVHSPDTKIKSLMQSLSLISYQADQEEVLSLVLRERAEIIGVIDREEHLLGVIHARDLIRIVEEEATEDVFRFAGVSAEEDVFDSPKTSISHRSKWLVLNVGTASIGAFVISQFHDTIAQMAILAAYMPMVGGLGGNSATQALAITVRGLARGELSWRDSKRIVVKEAITGFVNGIAVAIASGLLAFIFTRNAGIAIVLGSAMVINIMMSGIIGSLVPLGLKALNVDPAVASSIFVTAAIDVFGFLVFLGIATVVLL